MHVVDCGEHVNLPWPLVTMDFEASALGMRSYPIEVGLCRWQSVDAAIETWSTLIRPTDGWVAGGVWAAEAEQIHGIKRGQLFEGVEPAEAMRLLNDLVSSSVCWCDGGSQDDFWLGTLAYASRILPNFKLADWDSLGGALSRTSYERMVLWLDQTPAKHRACDDAERLIRAIAAGLGKGERESVPMVLD